jgi:uncharacterized membrane protein YjgN (DUF898 family)
MTDGSGVARGGQLGDALGVPCRVRFTGSALGLFKELFIGTILLIITLGVYTPWFICRVQRWFCRSTCLRDRAGKEVSLRFEGSGGELFLTFLAGCVLNLITLGIYGFWFAVKMHKFFLENTSGQTPDGQQVTLSFNGDGGELFKELFVGCLLTIVTFGIYTPWMMCSLSRFFTNRTSIHVGDSGHLSLSFQGSGGKLFVDFIIGYLLTIVTLGIYSFWLQVKLIKFFHGNTEVTTMSGNKLRVNFTGTGGELAWINISGILLTILTLGLYGFWFMFQLIEFQTDNLEITSDYIETPDGTMFQSSELSSLIK